MGANSITSEANGPLGNATIAIVLGDASTVASTYGGAGPNAVLLVTGANNTNVQNFSINRNIDSSAAANVVGRNDIGYANNNTGAQGTLTISSNWALSTGATRGDGLWAQQAAQILDFTGAIMGGNAAARFRVGDFGQGVGTVRLSNALNTYAGDTAVVTGTLLIAGDAGAASGVLGTNTTLRLAEGGNATPNNTALIDGAFTVGKTISLENGATPTSTWTLGGNQAVASSFTGNVNTVSNANSRTLKLSQASGGTVSFTGVIGANPDATGTTSIEKTGAGTAVLTNDNTYDGTTTVSNGTLKLNRGAADNTTILTDNNTATTSDIVINGGSLEIAASEQIADSGSINMSSGSLGFGAASGLTESIDKLTVSGGTFATGANQLIVGGATVTWSGGTNTISTGGLVSDKHWVITGGTNTVQLNGLLRVQSSVNTPNGLIFGGTSSPTITQDSDSTNPGQILLKQNVTVDATLTSGTAQILSAGSG